MSWLVHESPDHLARVPSMQRRQLDDRRIWLQLTFKSRKSRQGYPRQGACAPPLASRIALRHDHRGLSAFKKPRLMRGRRARPQLTLSILATGRCTGSQISARVLVKFDALLVPIRLFPHNAVEPIHSPFLKAEGGP